MTMEKAISKLIEYRRREILERKAQLSAEGTTFDVIRRQDAIDIINAAWMNDEISTVDAVDMTSSIRELPSAQTEIIHCKDCKHYQFADNRAFGMPVKMCKWFGFEDVDDDDFCSRAERRTG